MVDVLHIIDSGIPSEMIRQWSFLAGGGRSICLGPLPAGRLANLPITQIGSTIFPPNIHAILLKKKLSKPDIIHAWSLAALPAALAIGKVFSRTVLLSLPSLRGVDLTAPALKADNLAITIPCQKQAGELCEAGIARENLHVLPSAADQLGDDAAFAIRARESLDINPGRFIIVAPGEVVRQANHDLAIWTHGILENMGLNVQLLIPDNGKHLPFVRRFSDSMALQIPTIITAGSVDRKTILAASDIALFTTNSFTDAGAITACLAASIPIISPASAELDQIVSKDAALSCHTNKPADLAAATLRLIENTDLRKRLSAGAKKIHQQRYRVDLCQKVINKIYASLLS